MAINLPPSMLTDPNSTYTNPGDLANIGSNSQTNPYYDLMNSVSGLNGIDLSNYDPTNLVTPSGSGGGTDPTQAAIDAALGGSGNYVTGAGTYAPTSVTYSGKVPDQFTAQLNQAASEFNAQLAEKQAEFNATQHSDQEKLQFEEQLNAAKMAFQEQQLQLQNQRDSDTVINNYRDSLMKQSGPQDVFRYLFNSRGFSAPQGYQSQPLPIPAAVLEAYGINPTQAGYSGLPGGGGPGGSIPNPYTDYATVRNPFSLPGVTAYDQANQGVPLRGTASGIANGSQVGQLGWGSRLLVNPNPVTGQVNFGGSGSSTQWYQVTDPTTGQTGYVSAEDLTGMQALPSASSSGSPPGPQSSAVPGSAAIGAAASINPLAGLGYGTSAGGGQPNYSALAPYSQDNPLAQVSALAPSLSPTLGASSSPAFPAPRPMENPAAPASGGRATHFGGRQARLHPPATSGAPPNPLGTSGGVQTGAPTSTIDPYGPPNPMPGYTPPNPLGTSGGNPIGASLGGNPIGGTSQTIPGLPNMNNVANLPPAFHNLLNQVGNSTQVVAPSAQAWNAMTPTEQQGFQSYISDVKGMMPGDVQKTMENEAPLQGATVPTKFS